MLALAGTHDFTSVSSIVSPTVTGVYFVVLIHAVDSTLAVAVVSSVIGPTAAGVLAS
jgi:hypothetical protein